MAPTILMATDQGGTMSVLLGQVEQVTVTWNFQGWDKDFPKKEEKTLLNSQNGIK
jgi:hypothetical protein